MMPDNGQERRGVMLEYAKTLFNSGYNWISKRYVSIKRFVCKNAGKVLGQVILFIAKVLIEKLIEAFIEHLF